MPSVPIPIHELRDYDAAYRWLEANFDQASILDRGAQPEDIEDDSVTHHGVYFEADAWDALDDFCRGIRGAA